MATPSLQSSGYISITQLLQQHAEQFPNDIAMRQKRLGIWQETTWHEYRAKTYAIAAGLIELGVQQGEHVGILAENRQEWIVSQLGINSAGAVACGLYPTSPANEVEHLLHSADCTLVFCEDQEQVDKILTIRDRLPLLKTIVVIDPKGLANYDAELWMSLDDIIQRGQHALSDQGEDAVQQRLAQQTPDDTALIVFTSGSTGQPKAAMISYRNLWAEMVVLSTAISAQPGQNVLSYLPLCHIAEQAFSTLNAMAQRMVVNFGESLRTIRTDLQEISPDLFFGVPRIWEKMQSEVLVLAGRSGKLQGWLIQQALRGAQRRGQRPRAQWSWQDRLQHRFWYALIYHHILSYLGLARCHIAFTAAAPISPDLLAFFRGMGLPFAEIWGMTETTGAATMQPLDLNCTGRVGLPLPGVSLSIADDGELLIQGDIVFKGYYRNADATAETLAGGWLHTGDIAEQHADGSATIIDRKKDIMITAGGKNLSPSMIENEVKASAYIKECIVLADQQKYVTALIQINHDTVAHWAERQDIAFTTFRSLAENAAVKALIQSEVDRANQRLAPVEQIKKFTLLNKELDHDDGEVTATMKVKRKMVATRFAAEIAAMNG
ncbi:AMP-dependent synthetase/ligase [Salinispirillum marinum]|uniref:AMP-dependent synthetase/ligase n=2 Tax=Saccharospirillaceae TaxID=255527 RepID=A0ABV8BHC0_9GAMM